MTRESITSRSNRSPYEPPNIFKEESLLFNEQQKLLLNPEKLSTGSYSSPTPISFQASTKSAPFAQQKDSGSFQGTSSQPRIINRNYLQVQANNYNNRLSANSNQLKNMARVGTSQVNLQNVTSSNNNINGNNGPKRTRSISRSVRNLFNKTTGKRDKSYDSSSVYNANNTNFDMTSGLYSFFYFFLLILLVFFI